MRFSFLISKIVASFQEIHCSNKNSFKNLLFGNNAYKKVNEVLQYKSTLLTFIFKYSNKMPVCGLW